MARLSFEEDVLEPKRAKIQIQPTLGFSNEDKAGTIKSHDDALVVTLRIGGYDVRQVLWIRVALSKLCTPTYTRG